MEQKSILSAKGGIDVLSPEGEIIAGCVRSAVNVVIKKAGGLDRRAGATKVVTITRPHSLWSNADMTLFVAGGTLYKLNGLAFEAIAYGFTLPARYTEMGGKVYVSGAATLLRVDSDGTVTIPGVASMLSYQPTLTATTGGLPAGRYGVAFSAVSATGEESGLSNVEFIDLAASAGITVSLPAAVPGGVTRYRIYRTSTNGDNLYLVETIVAAPGTTTIAGGDIGRQEARWPLDLLPAGTDLTSYRGRLYSALGSFLFFDESLTPGLYDPRKNFFIFGDLITMVQAVEDGIYVGTPSRVYFLSGTKPSEMKLDVKATNGAFEHSSRLVDANMLDGKMIDTTKPCAVWLSPVGYQIGTPSGNVLSPQADKILLSDIVRAPTLAFVKDGIKQIVSATEALTLGRGGGTDSTP